MKRILILAPLFFVFLLSCDKVTNPIVKKTTGVGSKYVFRDNSKVSAFKKVLMEDYTGQRCKNCPTAAGIITNSLIPVYNNSLVVIAVHQGFDFAAPLKGAGFVNDFRTDAGEAWGGPAPGFAVGTFPLGMINRKGYSGSTAVTINYTSWTSLVPEALKEPLIVKLDMKTEYDTTVRVLNTRVKATFKSAYANATKILVVFTQDGIVGLQDVNGEKKYDYVFDHVMRGSINGNWGTDLTTAAAVANDSIKVSFDGFVVPTAIQRGTAASTDVDDKEVTVIAFVYDAVTKAVLQAEKIKIRGEESTH